MVQLLEAEQDIQQRMNFFSAHACGILRALQGHEEKQGPWRPEDQYTTQLVRGTCVRRTVTAFALLVQDAKSAFEGQETLVSPKQRALLAREQASWGTCKSERFQASSAMLMSITRVITQRVFQD